MVTHHNLRVNKESLLSIPDHQLHVGKRHIRNDMRVPAPQSATLTLCCPFETRSGSSIAPRDLTYAFPADFPQRLARFKKESGLSCSELTRRLGTYRHTAWRWTEGGVRPNAHHMMALLDLADDLGLGHLFAD